MPLRSYVIIAIGLVALVAGGFPDRLGFPVSLWYQWFDVATCLLAVPGAVRIARGLHARFWVGIALASPGLVYGLVNLYELANRIHPPVPGAFDKWAYPPVWLTRGLISPFLPRPPRRSIWQKR